MSELTDPTVLELFDAPNCAVLSTQNRDGSILSTVVWASLTDGELKVNSAVGRRWPTNLERDPDVTVVVMDPANPFKFVEVRGKAHGTTDGADEHIDALAKKYLNKDKYPFRQPGEERIVYKIDPTRVRVVQQ